MPNAIEVQRRADRRMSNEPGSRVSQSIVARNGMATFDVCCERGPNTATFFRYEAVRLRVCPSDAAQQKIAMNFMKMSLHRAEKRRVADGTTLPPLGSERVPPCDFGA